MELSIIIPVYKTEQYVRRCLESIFKQDFPRDRYEVIVVDDGTPDNSMAVVSEVVAGLDNVTVLHEENSGQSTARNLALTVAKGRYVWFVDSDDWVEEGSLARISALISGEQTDIFNFGYQYYFDGAYTSAPLPTDKMGYAAPGAHLYRREFLNGHGLRFMEGVYHEDFEFCPRAAFLAAETRNLKWRPYIVYKREGSTTTMSNPKKAFDLLRVARSLDDFQRQHEGADFTEHVALALNCSLQNTHIFRMDADNERRLNRELAANRDLWRSLWRSRQLKYKAEFVLFSLFPRHCVEVFKTLQKFNLRDFRKFTRVN